MEPLHRSTVADPDGRLHAAVAADGVRIECRFTDRADGDLAVDGEPEQLARRRARVAPGPWTWLRQVHGADVVVVTQPGEHAGAAADASVTVVPGAVLAVNTADCAGVLLAGRGPSSTVVGAAHAGWRGLVDGVLESTVAAMRDLGADDVFWVLGPCISPARYEFGGDDLDAVAERLGDVVRSTTSDGRPALDLRAGVASALGSVGAIGPADPAVPCTASEPSRYSWRAGRDTGRQSAVIWFAEP